MLATSAKTRSLVHLLALFKALHLPHFLKYIIFFSLIKGQKIRVRSKLELSNIWVNLDIGEFIEYWTFMDGLYEKHWIYKARTFVEGKIFIDIGANIGVYSLSLFPYAKYIYAFEPEKQNFKKFVSNLRASSINNVEVSKLAVTSKSKRRVKLHLNENDKGQHSLLIKSSYKYQFVETTTLDDFIKSNHITNIGLIKIDIEGAELEVLRGATRTIKRSHPPILMELNNSLVQLSGYSLSDLYMLMTKNGYRAYRLINGNLRGLTVMEIDNIYSENILFLHSSYKNSHT